MLAGGTRPLIRGTQGVVTSTHYVAALIGWEMLAKGGNAVDAACAAGFAMQVVEPHLCGPAGEAPILIYSAADRKVHVINGQGKAPMAATLEQFRALGLSLIPGTGLLAPTVPAAFHAWTTALERFGTLTLEDVLAPTVTLAEQGVPMLSAIAKVIDSVADTFRGDWPSSAAVYLPSDRVPAIGSVFRNPAFAETYRRLIEIESANRAKGREAAIRAARDAFYQDFVAEAIDAFCREAEVRDVTGDRHKAFLTGDDLARHDTPVEASVSADYAGLEVHKCGPWSQGPVFLQQLRLLAGYDLAAMAHNSADYIHTVIETAKLAFADRDAWYGDPDFVDVPLDTLLSPAYADQRRDLIDPDRASLKQRPGRVDDRDPDVRHLDLATRADAPPPPAAVPRPTGIGEPATTPLGEFRGDTVHVDVIDRDGNMVAATPSGGWLQSSPVIPPLGFPLGTRAQMFWLLDGHPNGLAPGKRPRTTLTPTIVTRDGAPYLAFGTPGGDQQEQWPLHFLLNHRHFGMNLQEAIEAPEYQSTHFPSSFYPRPYEPGALGIEARVGAETIEGLRRRGHKVTVLDDWGAGRHVGARIDVASGVIEGAASPRSPYAYAVGR
jgi:gamma-glutamyltranspeptidase/glutathione hydrolase